MKETWWQKKKNILISTMSFIFLAFVAYLLFHNLRDIHWLDVSAALSRVSASTITAALFIIAIIYGILTTYDFMGLKHLKCDFMTYPRVMVSAFVCYTFNFNLGALVGGVGFRYRVYTGWKVPKEKVPSLVIFSTITNWIGYVSLLGFSLLTQHERIQKLVPLPSWVLSVGGLVCFGLILWHIHSCYRGKEIKIKGVHFKFPSLSLVPLQFVLATIQWGLPAVVIKLFLQSMGYDVPYFEILSIHLLAGLAGAVTHIPAGLGLLETAFLSAGFSAPASDVLAAMLCFRAVYFLIPLLIAIPLYLSLELHQKVRLTK